MKIWTASQDIEQLNAFCQNTIHQSLGIQFTAMGENYLEASMPVDERTKQPIGLLHGGASVVLAESLGSVASLLVAGMETKACFGIEINASHLKSIRQGKVIGRVTPIRLGKGLHVWEIKTRNENDPDYSNPLCICRLTVMVK